MGLNRPLLAYFGPCSLVLLAKIGLFWRVLWPLHFSVPTRYLPPYRNAMSDHPLMPGQRFVCVCFSLYNTQSSFHTSSTFFCMTFCSARRTYEFILLCLVNSSTCFCLTFCSAMLICLIMPPSTYFCFCVFFRSGNWHTDRLTIAEKLAYQRAMGFDK